MIPVSTRTFKLNHASAKELADLFNATYAPKDQNGKITTQIASSFPGANVVVVTTSDKILADCEAADKKLYMDLQSGWYNASFFFATGADCSYDCGGC